MHVLVTKRNNCLKRLFSFMQMESEALSVKKGDDLRKQRQKIRTIRDGNT